MSNQIIVISDHEHAEQLVVYLERQNSDLIVALVSTLEELESHLELFGPNTRLLSFCSGVIIPARLLAMVTQAPYNIHPGSPAFPGSHPDAFAIVERASEFGATAHEMIDKVDAGPIVDVELFPIALNSTAEQLRDQAFVAAVELFTRIADHCVRSYGPLPVLPGTHWGKRKTSRKDYQALCQISPVLTAHDLSLLKRACGRDLVEVQATMPELRRAQG